MKKYPELHSMWVENINKVTLVKFVPTNKSRLCSKHFSADMFAKTGYSKRTVLKPNAVPTIFDECSGQVQFYISPFIIYFVVNYLLYLKTDKTIYYTLQLFYAL